MDQQQDLISFTALPNGFEGGLVRISVVLTPSILTAAPVAPLPPAPVPQPTTGKLSLSAFHTWPKRLGQAHTPLSDNPACVLATPNLEWTVTFTRCVDPNRDGNYVVGPDQPIHFSATNAAPDCQLRPDLWNAIFGQERHSNPRTTVDPNDNGTPDWNISPPLDQLHNRHKTIRAIHASASILQIDTGTGASAATSVSASDAVPVLYIFPANKEDQSRAKLVAHELQVRPAALTLKETIGAEIAKVPTVGSDRGDAFISRVEHARMALEPDNKTWLTPMALYAVYRHCLESLASKNVDLSSSGQDTALDKVLKAQWELITGKASEFTETADLDTHQQYIEFLLFHRRHRKQADPPKQLPTPDFHELQGLLHTYPAMLRPLGLAFDLTCQAPPPGIYQVQAIPNVAFPTVPHPYPGSGPFEEIYTTQNATVCSVNGPSLFYAVERPGSQMLSGRYLNLGDAEEFALVQEDADGAALKFIDQATNLARSGEFGSKTVRQLPTGFFPTPAPSADPSTALPAPRTVGVSLLHSSRINHAESGVARPSSTFGTADPPVVLYAEDIMLGFRVDVQRNGGPWRSLCARTSEYQVTPLGQEKSDSDPRWRPPKPDADEGFVSFSATHTDDGDDDDTSQTKLHPSLFTWTGWSLSVSAPPFDAVNPSNSTAHPKDRPLQIDGNFKVAAKSLPPLRFDDEIAVRCRAVDLAGNSEPVSALGGASAILSPSFSRHEPHRAPLVLLTEPLDRDSSPGEHVDRLVAHDNKPSHERILVPPRESLRLAELSKVLDKHKGKLPDSAFGNCLLMADGTFPSVKAARDQQWLPPLKRVPVPQGGTPEQVEKIRKDADKRNATDEQDAIFLSAEGKIRIKNVTPYLPDPSAHYIRVDAFLVSEDSTLSTALLPDSNSHYIHIDIFDAWPDFLATRVILEPVEDAEPSIRLDNGSRPPILRVKLPPGKTVVLQLSSAPNNGTTVDWVAPPNMSLFHTTVAYLKSKSPNADIAKSLQDVDAIGSVQMVQRVFGEVTDAPRRSGEAKAETKATAVEAAGAVPVNAAATPVALTNFVSAPVFGSGHVAQVTPRRTVTFVHAIRQPIPLSKDDRNVAFLHEDDSDVSVCAPIELNKDDSGPIFASLTVKRTRGSSRGIITASVKAHWLTTGKIVCQATWTDIVDDISKSSPSTITRTDSVLSLTDSATKRPDRPPVPGEPPIYSRSLQGDHFHLLPDTRARCIQYRLIGATQFREYYPEAKDSGKDAVAGKRTLAGPQIEKDFVRYGDVTTVLVKSSARPPAAVVSYIIPAYAWEDTYDKASHTWRSGRIGVLRVYLERPFRVSGDRESIGLVLAHNVDHTPTNEDTQPLVSRWGADPIKPIHKTIIDSALTVGNLCDRSDALRLCQLAEGGFAQVKPYPVNFNPRRNLWYADIPVDSLGSLAPFLRLAIVRWQPDALHENLKDSLPAPVSTDPNVDCRISTVTTADFIQLNSERWASVHRVDRHTFSITVSGPRPSVAGGAYVTSGNVSFSAELQVRWSASGNDTGWRPEASVDGKTGPVDLTPDPALSDGDEMTCWKITVKLKSTFFVKQYRIMLRERESYLDRLDKPVSRLVYAKFIDLF